MALSAASVVAALRETRAAEHPVLLAAGALVFLFAVLYHFGYRTTNVPRIKGIPQIPGAVPFAGHLPLLGGRSGKADTTLWTEWHHQHGWPLFQLQYGQERIVVANTYALIREIWVAHASSTISRPVPWTVEHHIGLEMGAQPWNDSVKRMRGAAIKSVAPGTWRAFYPGLDRDMRAVVGNMREQGGQGKTALELGQFLSLVAMNLGFLLSYGKTCDELGGVDFLHGFIRAASKITDIRVGSGNWVDYIPFFRLFPSRAVSRGTLGVRERQPYLDKLFASMKADVEKGKDTSCIGASLLSDKEARLSSSEIKSTCISMLQGSSETIAGTLTCGFGSLCADDAGRQLQDDLYAAILARWGSPQDAFEHALDVEDIPLVVATYKEMMRYYCIVTYALPRKVIRDIVLQDGTCIPKGTTLYMNAEGGNHDPAFYGPDANTFNPRRFLPENADIYPGLAKTPLPHFGYGAGARICPALQISNRILYAFIVRLVVAFRFVASDDAPPCTDPVRYNTAPKGFVAKPKTYTAYCIPREGVAV